MALVGLLVLLSLCFAFAVAFVIAFLFGFPFGVAFALVPEGFDTSWRSFCKRGATLKPNFSIGGVDQRHSKRRSPSFALSVSVYRTRGVQNVEVQVPH